MENKKKRCSRHSLVYLRKRQRKGFYLHCHLQKTAKRSPSTTKQKMLEVNSGIRVSVVINPQEFWNGETDPGICFKEIDIFLLLAKRSKAVKFGRVLFTRVS
ncbi:hypothetical protein SLE2022_101670 [Rubroshorea leprosula]